MLSIVVDDDWRGERRDFRTGFWRQHRLETPTDHRADQIISEISRESDDRSPSISIRWLRMCHYSSLRRERREERRELEWS